MDHGPAHGSLRIANLSVHIPRWPRPPTLLARRRRFAPCSGSDEPARADRARAAIRSPISPVLSVARSRRRRSSSGTSAAMKIVTLPATSSCTLSAPSSSSSSTQTLSLVRDSLHLRAKRPVAPARYVRHPFEELALLDPARELLVGEKPVLAPVELLPGRCGRVVAETATSTPATRSSRPLISVPLPAPDGPVTTKTGRDDGTRCV